MYLSFEKDMCGLSFDNLLHVITKYFNRISDLLQQRKTISKLK